MLRLSLGILLFSVATFACHSDDSAAPGADAAASADAHSQDATLSDVLGATDGAVDAGADVGMPGQDAAVSFYGEGIAADSLDNHQVAATDVDIRFIASTTGDVASVRWYDIYTIKCAPHSSVDAGTCPNDCAPSGSVYACGTGGDMHICIQGDDGTAQHLSNGVDLGCVDHPNASGPPYFPLETFPSPAPHVTKGALYHLHWHNTNANPTVNFTSVDTLYVTKATTPRQPTVSDLDLAVFRGTMPRPQDTGLFQLVYADGTVQGQGYIEVWIGAPKVISGGAKVREQLTVSGADRSVSLVGVRLNRDSGSSALTVRLETGAGSLLEEGTIPAATFVMGAVDSGTSATWATLSFATPHVLASGQSYALVLSAPADTVYEAFAVERGASYGFTAPTFFGDGYGQYTTDDGGTWSGFDQPGGATDSKIADMQFYFR